MKGGDPFWKKRAQLREASFSFQDNLVFLHPFLSFFLFFLQILTAFDVANLR